jgi:hypothetical protein
VGGRIRVGRPNEPLVLIEVVKGRRVLGHWQQPDRARHPVQCVPFHGGFQQLVEHGQYIVDGFRRSALECAFAGSYRYQSASYAVISARESILGGNSRPSTE